MRIDGKRLTSWQRRRLCRDGEAGVSTSKRQADEVKEEQLLRAECAEAKLASEGARKRYRLREPAEPGDKEIVEIYSRAKAAMRVWHASRKVVEPQSTPEASDSGKRKFDPQNPQVAAKRVNVVVGGSSTSDAASSDATNVVVGGFSTSDAACSDVPPTRWTCEVCNVTISVRADGRAREQHLAGKAHARNVMERGGGLTHTSALPALRPTVPQPTVPPLQQPLAPKPAPDPATAVSAVNQEGAGDAPPTRWTCEVCNVTISVRADGRAREQHLAGKAHARNMMSG